MLRPWTPTLEIPVARDKPRPLFSHCSRVSYLQLETTLMDVMVLSQQAGDQRTFTGWKNCLQGVKYLPGWGNLWSRTKPFAASGGNIGMVPFLKRKRREGKEKERERMGKKGKRRKVESGEWPFKTRWSGVQSRYWGNIWDVSMSGWGNRREEALRQEHGWWIWIPANRPVWLEQSDLREEL